MCMWMYRPFMLTTHGIFAFLSRALNGRHRTATRNCDMPTPAQAGFSQTSAQAARHVVMIGSSICVDNVEGVAAVVMNTATSLLSDELAGCQRVP